MVLAAGALTTVAGVDVDGALGDPAGVSLGEGEGGDGAGSGSDGLSEIERR